MVSFFFSINKMNPYEASIPIVLYFLTEAYNQGSQYGTLNSYRSALALVLGPNVSNDDRLTRFFKGIFNLRPPQPKYNFTWDTSTVLNFLSQKYPNKTLSLEDLSKKCAMLIALTTAHRMQTLSKINIKNIDVLDSKIMIKIPDLLKTSKPHLTHLCSVIDAHYRY